MHPGEMHSVPPAPAHCARCCPLLCLRFGVLELYDNQSSGSEINSENVQFLTGGSSGEPPFLVQEIAVVTRQLKIVRQRLTYAAQSELFLERGAPQAVAFAAVAIVGALHGVFTGGAWPGTHPPYYGRRRRSSLYSADNQGLSRQCPYLWDGSKRRSCP